MNALLIVSSILIVIGAFFRLEHYPFGNLILWIGFISSLILSSVEIPRLKRIIKELETKINRN